RGRLARLTRRVEPSTSEPSARRAGIDPDGRPALGRDAGRLGTGSVRGFRTPDPPLPSGRRRPGVVAAVAVPRAARAHPMLVLRVPWRTPPGDVHGSARRAPSRPLPPDG